MKKKIIIVGTLICSCIAFAVVNNWIVRIVLVAGLLYILLAAFGYKKYREFINKHIPDILTNMRRNYDQLYLGKRYNNHDTETDNSKCLNLSNYHRNLYTDILVLERWHSFLKRNGTVCFNIDCASKSYLLEKKISIFDDGYLHQVTLLQHGKDPRSIVYKFVAFSKGIYFFLLRNFAQKSNNIQLSDEEIKEVNELLKIVNTFCEVRNLRVEYNFYNCSDEIKKIGYCK